MGSAVVTPLSLVPPVGHDHPINHIAFSRDGRTMATADTGMNIRVWRDRQAVRAYDVHTILDKVRPTERIRGVRFDSSGERLFVAAGDHVAAYRLDAADDEPEWAYTPPRLFAFLVVSPTGIAVSSGDSMAAAFDNGSLAAWSAEGAGLGIIRHNAAPRTLAFLPDESILGTDSFSWSLWQAGRRKPVWHRPSKDRIYGMAVSDDGRYAALRRLFTTGVYEVESGSQVAEYRQGRGLPLVLFLPGGHRLALGTQHAVDIYEVGGERQARLALEEAELVSLAALPDASQIFAGCSDGLVRAWDDPLRSDRAAKGA